MWSSDEQPKLKAKDIRTFYSILQIANEKENPEPLAHLYRNFVRQVCNAEKVTVDQDDFIKRILLQMKGGLFNNRIDPTVLNLIIRDIALGGEFIKKFLKESRRPTRNQELLTELEATHAYAEKVPRLASGKKKQLASQSDYESTVSKLEEEVNETKYPYNPLKCLMELHYKEGKKLANAPTLAHSIVALNKALNAYELIKNNQQSQPNKRVSDQQYEDLLVDKIRNKLVLVLSEYASQVIEKKGATLINYQEGIENLKSALDYLNSVNKKTTDLTYLIEKGAYLIRKLAFYQYKCGVLLSEEKNYTKSIQSLIDAMTSLLSLTEFNERDRKELNKIYRELASTFYKRAVEKYKSASEKNSKEDLQSSLEDYREAIATWEKVNPSTEEDRRSLAALHEKKDKLLSEIIRINDSIKDSNERPSSTLPTFSNSPVFSSQLTKPIARRPTAQSQTPVFRSPISYPSPPHSDQTKIGSLSNPKMNPFSTFQKKETKGKEEKTETETKKSENKGPDSGPSY